MGRGKNKMSGLWEQPSCVLAPTATCWHPWCCFWGRGRAWQLPALLVHDQSNLLGQIQIEAAGNLPSAGKLLFPKKSNSCQKKKSSLFLLPGGVMKAPTINAGGQQRNSLGAGSNCEWRNETAVVLSDGKELSGLQQR